MAEINAEVLAVAHETTKGTAIANPTKILPFNTALTPMEEIYERNIKDGTYHELPDDGTERLRLWTEFDGEMGLDTRLLPFILEVVAKSGGVKTTPGGGTNSRLWTYTDATGLADLRTMTMWWGDPSVEVFSSTYGFIEELTITADGEGTDGTMMSINGMARAYSGVGAPTYPNLILGPSILPGKMEAWLDVAASIGTTSIIGKITKVEHVLTNNLTTKFPPQGPSGTGTFTRIGRGKRSLTTTVTMELLDTTQFDLWDARTKVGLRIRHNGPIIEGSLRHYVEVDTYGRFRDLTWGEYEGTNRTLTLTLKSEVLTSLGSGWSIKVQNDRDTL